MRLANANLIRREDKLKILDKINSDISNNMEKSPVRNSTNKYDSNNNFNSEYYNLNSIGNEFVPEERSIFSVERKTHTNIFAKSITGKRVSSMSITSVKLQESNKFPIPITNGEFKNLNNSNSGKIINTRYSTNVKLTKQQIDFYVPCINCNNQIKFDEIDNHSNECTQVKLEVFEADVVPLNLNILDGKLIKLKENMLRIKEKYDKDNYYFSYITEYISNALNFSSINLTSYIELRKTLTNIETLLIECKGKFGVQIMIERTKYLIKEKVKKLKEKLISEKFNLSQEMIKNELEKAKNDKKNLIEKLKIEKEKLKTIKSEKINSLKKSKKSTNRNFYSPDVVSLHAQERISNASNNLLCQNFEIEESSKDEYKDFVKVVLKTKFEKIKSDHPGQKIPDKILFLECQKQKIQRIDYEMFIVSELNKFEKYSKYIFRRSGKLANKVNNLINNQAPRVTNFKVKPLNDMDIINEESFN